MEVSYQHHSTKQIAVDRKGHEEGKESSSAATVVKQSASASPPSASSSPSHEFSFTISLHSSSTTIPDTTTTTNKNNNNKSKTTLNPSFAIDLSPADEIFFHGHLLPLHLLSHLPVSPRSSTNSLDSFTLPIRDLIDEDPKPEKKFASNSISTCSHQRSNEFDDDHDHDHDQTKGRAKSKSFSLLGFGRWRKGYEVEDNNNKNQDKEKEKKNVRFDVISHVIKKYVRMVRPLLHFRGGRENGRHLQRQPYSFSGNLSFRSKQQKQDQLVKGRRRGEFSAPASIRTSPTNSGLLVATTNSNFPSSSMSHDSSMEELQAAIQSAIAHCKNSIAVEEKLKC